MKFDDKVYDVLKWVCLICLPALGVLYSALDGAFGWGMINPVCTVIAAIQAFLGALIGVSTKTWKDLQESQKMAEATGVQEVE